MLFKDRRQRWACPYSVDDGNYIGIISGNGIQCTFMGKADGNYQIHAGVGKENAGGLPFQRCQRFHIAEVNIKLISGRKVPGKQHVKGLVARPPSTGLSDPNLPRQRCE